MIGARFYTQLDAALSHNDVIEQELSKVRFCFISIHIYLYLSINV